MDIVEKFLVLLFGAIVVGLVVANPKGIQGILAGFGNFTSKAVGAFAGGNGGFVRG